MDLILAIKSSSLLLLLSLSQRANNVIVAVGFAKVVRRLMAVVVAEGNKHAADFGFGNEVDALLKEAHD